MSSFCWGTNGRELLKELSRSEFLPPYNTEGVRKTLAEMQEIIDDMLATTRAEGFDSNDPETYSSVIVSHSGFNRNKRCLLAYMRYRMRKIEELRMEVGRIIPQNIKHQLSVEEQNYFRNFSNLTEKYMKDIGYDLTTNTKPPKEPFVEVRVLESCGEIFTEDGTSVNLEENTTHYLRRTDVEQLIRQGYLEECN
jgi:GINS complex subunit 1